jgi:hypothetical protein
MSMRVIVNIFSASVLGDTLPNPTEVSPVIVKYTDVIYRDWNGLEWTPKKKINRRGGEKLRNVSPSGFVGGKQRGNSYLWPVPGRPTKGGRFGTVDLLVLTSLEQLIFWFLRNKLP